MQKQFMAVLNDGWKFYEGTGSNAKRIHYVEGQFNFNGTEIKTWEDIEAAVSLRGLTTVLRFPRLVTFEVGA